MDWLSLCIPFAYLGILLGSLATFSSLYRKRKTHKASSLKPWFPTHVQRDIYLSLVGYDPTTTTATDAASDGGKDKKAAKKPPRVPETVLKAALLRRAIEDVRRLLEIRNQKPALAALLQKGSISDDVWQRFSRAEQEMDLEIREVIAEANRYLPGWGQGIFQTANEIIINEAIRAKIADTQATAKLERQAWDKRAAEMQHELMQEIGAADNTKTAAAPGAAATTTATSASTSTSAATSRKSSVSGPAAPASVDVASTAPTSSQPSTPVTPTTPGAGSGSSKKKGKKKGRK